MAYIGQKPADKPLGASDITDGIISNSKLGQDIISAETELATAPADTDEFLISDAGTLKRIDASLVGGGSYELLATTTASNVSSFALNGYFTSDYDIYKFFLYNVYAGNSDQDLKLSVNTTGSYTEQTAGSNYFYTFRRLDGTTSSGTNSEDAGSYQNAKLMVGRISDQSAKMSNTEITFYKPTDSSNYKIVTSHFGGWNSSTEICTGTSTGVYLSTTAVTGVTFSSQNGNIWCEKAYLYGIKNS
jgi:hypothetical protein|tara:strand:+ start:305 stop:1039 length:735 start_codon:yes stop_codon:yes gene_type:complete